MVPTLEFPPLMLSTDQSTPELLMLVKLAVNCCAPAGAMQGPCGTTVRLPAVGAGGGGGVVGEVVETLFRTADEHPVNSTGTTSAAANTMLESEAFAWELPVFDATGKFKLSRAVKPESICEIPGHSGGEGPLRTLGILL